VRIKNGGATLVISQWPETMSLKELADEGFLQAGSEGCDAVDCVLLTRSADDFRQEAAEHIELEGRLRQHMTVIATQGSHHVLLLEGTGTPDVKALEERVEFIGAE